MSRDGKMTELADAIRSKTGKTGKLSIPKMVSALTPSEIVYWNGDMSGGVSTHLLAKPIPAHTKISDIIVTSDKPTDSTSGFMYLYFKNPEKVRSSYIFYSQGRWIIDTNVANHYGPGTELPDDLIEIRTFVTINNLKIVVKGADSGSSELPTYTTVFQAYTGLANAIKKSTGNSGKLTIEKMIILLGGTTSKDDTPATPSKTVTVF